MLWAVLCSVGVQQHPWPLPARCHSNPNTTHICDNQNSFQALPNVAWGLNNPQMGTTSLGDTAPRSGDAAWPSWEHGHLEHGAWGDRAIALGALSSSGKARLLQRPGQKAVKSRAGRT